MLRTNVPFEGKFQKSVLLRFGCGEEELMDGAAFLNCETGECLFVYLGIPVGGESK